MSTNKSQNLNLHLWEPEDDFLRTEFNENFAALDTAVKAEETARQSAVSSLQSSISSTGSTAASAVNSLRTELTNKINAAYSPTNRCCAAGTYVGNGDSSNPVKVTLGFRPTAVFIVEPFKTIIQVYPQTDYVVWYNDGFGAKNTSTFNQAGHTHTFVAIR